MVRRTLNLFLLVSAIYSSHGFNTEDVVLKRIVRCAECQQQQQQVGFPGPPPPPLPPPPPPGCSWYPPPPPPPFISTRNWSGYQRWPHGRHGVFSGAAATAQFPQSSGEAYSLASADTGPTQINNGFRSNKDYDETLSSGSKRLGPQAESSVSSQSSSGNNFGHGYGHEKGFGQRQAESSVSSQSSISGNNFGRDYGHEKGFGQRQAESSVSSQSSSGNNFGHGYGPENSFGQREDQSQNFGYNEQRHEDSENLQGALNLASQGLQIQQGCSTCEQDKSNSAHSHAKSNSGSAVAVAVAG